ncbi:glutamate-5-semialdehyde dehydrogenase [Rapidithrix thailandica]|uniref:Gamma-glutamyl phosphate reductase n=1 Tax=Rapidithrix thailandica TaxID=413964 RepID=A0AAW9SDE8_9BACT
MKNRALFEKVQQASAGLNLLEDATINALLKDLSVEAVKHSASLLEANQKDLDRMAESDPKYDRLKLTTERIEGIAGDILNVSTLPSPLGKILLEKELPNGLKLKKVSVPLGVIGIIYEARPNVTFDVFALCLKSGNACVLKGGSDAEFSNKVIVQLIQEVIRKHGVNPDILQLLPPDREATAELLNAVGYVDILIPRGSQGLISFVRDNAKVPVIETGAGIVHTYFDKSADLEKGTKIIANAKTRRVSVCNALDCLVIHQDRLDDLPQIAGLLAEKKVEIFADASAFESLKGHYPENLLHPATEEHFGTEFLDYKMSVKTVSGLEEAMAHIGKYSSKHSEAILAEDEKVIEKFLRGVDAAAVYANTSTAYTDGAQFGLGAEIGISTQKLHARGPMALEELTSYKWVVRGDGQVRES